MSALMSPFDLSPEDGRHRFIQYIFGERDLPQSLEQRRPKLFVITECTTVVDVTPGYLVRAPQEYASPAAFEEAFTKDPSVKKYRKKIDQCRSAGMPTDWPIVLLIYPGGCYAEPTPFPFA